MSNELSRVEREVILKALKDELPEMQLSTRDGQSFSLPAGGYTVTDSGTLLCAAFNPENHAVSGIAVKVFFYCKKRGLFFYSQIRRSAGKYEITVPPQIIKQLDTQVSGDTGIVCTVSYGAGSWIPLGCRVSDTVPLFETDPGAYMPAPAKAGTESVVRRLSDTEPGVDAAVLFAAARYFSGTDDRAEKSIQGRVEPLQLLYISDTCIVFGASGETRTPGTMYRIRLEVPSVTGGRTIQAVAEISQILAAPEMPGRQKTHRRVEVCSFCRLQKEDRRFLFEKLYKTRYCD